jgi:predicted double-glycine peptidase
MRTKLRSVASLIVGALLVVARADAHALLDVPYVSQTPELCGGAAVSMVLRYWGEREVFPQDFASLASAADGGILTGALASSVRDRGWQALVVPAAEETARQLIQSEIDRGRPLIALIEVEPRVYHYVVIVGSTDEQVVFHDPARAPYRVLSWAQFDRAWAGTGRWMMLVLPPGELRSAEATTPATVRAGQTPCAALVGRGVQMAIAGDRDGADEELQAATAVCPNDPGSWRELAGLRFSQTRWPEARDLALVATRLAPQDTDAWQLVATSRYLMGDMAGALDAWNHTGAPRIDAIDIHGAGRTRQPVVARAAGLLPRQVLTPDALGRALRRMQALPVASNARMRYEPVFTAGGALAKVDVFLDERQLLPRGWSALATLASRAWLLDEIRVDVAGPLGAGDLESATWRWSPRRPRVAFGLALPSPQWFLGTIALDVSWERQSYDSTPLFDSAGRRRDTRRRAALRVADWSTSWLRWQTGGALDRLPVSGDRVGNPQNARDYLALESALDARLAGDRLAMVVSAGWWTPFAAGGNRFATGDLQAAWRSTVDAAIPSLSATSGIHVASRVAPLALWEGAGTGQGRTALLRAHPLLNNDVITGAVFGRDVVHGSLEYARTVGHTIAGGFALAGFVDAARAWQRLTSSSPSPLYVDAGVGARVRVTGSGAAIRIDLARGLRGGGTTLSASWQEAWPW